MAGELNIAGVDLAATLGFNFTDEGGILGAVAEVPQELGVPGMPGALILGPNNVPVREFTLRGYLGGTTQAAVRTNLHKLQALVGGGNEVPIQVADWAGVQINAVCTRIPGQSGPFGGSGRANAQNEIPFKVEMPFRAITDPYWRDVAATVITFNTSHTAMAQGTAPAPPVLTSPTGVLAACTLTGYDFNDVLLWSCTLAALGGASDKYRITTTRGVMSIEKSVDGGATWAAADASITAGIFPMVLPSDPIAYQTSAWSKLAASVGTWTSTYNKRWR